jgi:hypothetical protein
VNRASAKKENHAWNIEQEILAQEENLTQGQPQLDAGRWIESCRRCHVHRRNRRSAADLKDAATKLNQFAKNAEGHGSGRDCTKSEQLSNVIFLKPLCINARDGN